MSAAHEAGWVGKLLPALELLVRQHEHPLAAAHRPPLARVEAQRVAAGAAAHVCARAGRRDVYRVASRAAADPVGALWPVEAAAEILSEAARWRPHRSSTERKSIRAAPGGAPGRSTELRDRLAHGRSRVL